MISPAPWLGAKLRAQSSATSGRAARSSWSPTVAVKPPRHGRGVFVTRSMSFCKYGNLADATGLAVPFGTFPGTPVLPRSIQIMGPPGSEDAVLDLGARLTRS